VPGKSLFQRREAGKPDDLASNRGGCAQILFAARLDKTENHANRPAIWGMSVDLPSHREVPMKHWRTKAWAGALAIVASLTAINQAGAIVLGTLSDADSMFGMGTVTRDSATNLEWLDLDLTTAYSFNSVTAQFGPAGAFPGFAIATPAQVNTMINDSGILGATGAAAQMGFDTYVSLLNGMVDDFGGGVQPANGCVLVLSGIANNSGALSINGVGIDRTPMPPSDGCGPVVPGSEFITQGPVPPSNIILPNQTIDAHNASSPTTLGGIYLVSPSPSQVSEPPVLASLALGMLLLGILRSRSRRA
jgi:hypothetical protein